MCLARTLFFLTLTNFAGIAFSQLCEPDPIYSAKNLEELGQLSATDKRCKQHCYLYFYDKFFSHLRQKKPKVLEVGIFNGGSILMWSRYFQCADVHAWDLNRKQPPFLIESKATYHHVDQLKIGTMDDAAADVGPEKFDVIVDDGLHSTVSMWNTFAALWPWVKPGGYYVAEDLHGCLHGKKWVAGSGDMWNWCDQPDGAPTMFMMLHFFNESRTKGVAAAEKVHRDFGDVFPRLDLWRAFGDDMASIEFKARNIHGPCTLKPFGDETSQFCGDVTAVITKKR